jgi:hypothetical protein
MAEFSSSWSDSVVADFKKFDLNGDGFITAKECHKAGSGGATRGTTVAVASPPPASPSGSATATSAASPTPTAPATPSSPANVDLRALKYYQSLVRKYDRNNDGVLSVDEWKAMSNDPSAADTNKDGRITGEELAVWSTKR